MSPQKALDLAHKSDILLHVGVPSQQDFYRPSKLAEYLLARKPIMGFCSPGAEEEFLNKANGFYGNILQQEHMITTLNNLYDTFKAGDLKNHIPPLKFVRNFQIDHVAMELNSFVRQIIAR